MNTSSRTQSTVSHFLSLAADPGIMLGTEKTGNRHIDIELVGGGYCLAADPLSVQTYFLLGVYPGDALLEGERKRSRKKLVCLWASWLTLCTTVFPRLLAFHASITLLQVTSPISLCMLFFSQFATDASFCLFLGKHWNPAEGKEEKNQATNSWLPSFTAHSVSLSNYLTSRADRVNLC